MMLLSITNHPIFHAATPSIYNPFWYAMKLPSLLHRSSCPTSIRQIISIFHQRMRSSIQFSNAVFYTSK